MPRPVEALHYGGNGECAGSVTAKKLVSATKFARWVKVKAALANNGTVFVGTAGVTKMAGTDTTTAGWPLSKGQETDWLPVPDKDLSKVYVICDNATDHSAYEYAI